MIDAVVSSAGNQSASFGPATSEPKHIMRIVSLIMLATMLISCAGPVKRVSRSDWLKLSSRVYDIESAEPIFAAAEKVFDLADGSDVRISHTKNTMTASRWAAPFPSNIHYRWHITSEPKNGKVLFWIELTSSAMAMFITTQGTILSPDVIRLFWSRVDYMLGKNENWLSCDEFAGKNPGHSTLEPLCLLANDDAPK